jgi:uncharacterized protein YcnI
LVASFKGGENLPSLQTYLEYNDPSIVIWRKGTPDDAFKSRLDSLPVINNLITLLEIPSDTYKVQIAGLTEVSQELYLKKVQLEENEFIVDYAIGVVQFNAAHEGKTFVLNYLGKGKILLPASRIYAMVKQNPDVVVTLQDVINESQSYLQTLSLKLTEINLAITNAQQATSDANIAADNASLAAYSANQAALTAYHAAESTIVIRKDPVDEYSDIAIVYPDPENGWEVTINTTGDYYRYDGVYSHTWQWIGNYFGGTIPYASETSDGLLRKEDYQNFVLRTAIFQIPKILSQGVQSFGSFQMPWDGEFVKASAFCIEKGIMNPVEISIERISLTDLDGGLWDNIFSQNLIIAPSDTTSTGGTILDTQGEKGDFLRLYVSQFDGSMKGITIQLDIKTKHTV